MAVKRIKNVSPLGALDVPALGRVVTAGEVVEVEAGLAARLLEQSDNWKPTKASATKKGNR